MSRSSQGHRTRILQVHEVNGQGQDSFDEEAFLRQNSTRSVVSNASSDGMPPAPRKAGWLDRLSGTSDNIDPEDTLCIENTNDNNRDDIKDAWGGSFGRKSKSKSKKKGKQEESHPKESRNEQDVKEPVDGQAAKYRKVYDKFWGTFSNLAYVDDDDNGEEAAAIEQVFLGIVNNIKTTEETLQVWKQQRQEIRENTRNVHEEIEQRKQEVVEMVEQYAQGLHGKVERLSEERLDQATSSIAGLKDTMKDMQKVAEKNFKEDKIKARGLKQTRGKLEKICAQFDRHNNEPSPWEPIVLQEGDKSSKLVGAFFGTLQGGVSASLLTGMLDNDEKRTGIGSVLPQPELLGTFGCKTSKDSRECGVTDVAVTRNNHIVVVDKHNKLVKVYDSNGVFQSFIGRKTLKEPSRVSLLSANDHMLITDMATKSIKIFHHDGRYVGEFASDLKYPICHREMYDGNIAVLEYATKSVIVYDPTLKQLHSFDTELECPAYMACTKNNNFVITDWRNHLMKIFDAVGNDIASIKGPGEAEGSINSPQGVCADRYGNILVAEKGNRRVQVFTEDGQFIQNLHGENIKLKIPWALACNKYDLLVVGEYQGYVQLLKYLHLPFNTIMSKDYQSSKSKYRRGSHAGPSTEDDTKC